MIHSQEDLARLIDQVGILPFFANTVAGWSVEENIDPACWFTSIPGPWEWKGPLAAEKTCVYGKFIHRKAAFISPRWFADLANWRREGYAWDERVDDDLAPYHDRLLMDYLAAHPGVLSKYAKRECGFTKGFDTVLTRLQMQTYVVTSDFQYDRTKDGAPYGWGNAVIDLADKWLGEDFWAIRSGRTPEESFEGMVAHLMGAMPQADEGKIRKELK